MQLEIGELQITTVPGGDFRLDGGAMFGVVPRPLWTKRSAPDEQNRIALATNCTLVRVDGLRVLIDTGYGTKLTEKERKVFATESDGGVVASLAAAGVRPEEIDVVVFSHLHFDHAGGGTVRSDSGRIVPTFPNARYCVQRKEWETATSGLSEWVTSYPPENFECLADTGQLELIDGDREIVPGVRVILTGGHSPGHQLVVLESEGQLGVYLGDICPTWNHLRQMWCMAYDAHVSEVRRKKPEILGWLADSSAWLLSDHDPQRPWVKIRRDGKREFVVVDGSERG